MKRLAKYCLEKWHSLREAESAAVPPLEAFRMVRLALGAEPVSGARLVAVTSAVSGDGSAEVAAGLGHSLSEERQSVLLVDFDLFQPRLHQLLSVDPSPGLSDFLEDESIPLDQIAQRLDSRTHVVASGDLRAAPPASFYGRSSLGRVIAALRARPEDVAIVVVPPILEASGARTLGALADDLLLAVRAGVTRERDLREVRGIVARDRLPLRGAIMTVGASPPEGSGEGVGSDALDFDRRESNRNEPASVSPGSALPRGGRLF